MAASTTTVSALPNEMLAKVLGYLKPGDRGRAARVCRWWRDALDGAWMWKDATVTVNLDKLTPASAESLRKHHVLHARISQCSDAKMLQQFLQDMPTLRSLDLTLLHGLAREEKLHALPDMPALEKLDIWYNSEKHLELICTRMRNLKSLSLSYWYVPFGNSYLNVLSQSPMPSVTELSLACFVCNDRDIDHLTRGLPNLQKVFLILGRDASETGIESLSMLPFLKEARLSCSNDAGISIKPLSNGSSKLRVLGLFFPMNEENAGDLAKMGHLEELELEQVQDSHLESLTRGLSRQRRLRLDDCRDLTASGVKHLAKMSQLETLRVYISSIDDEGLMRLSTGLRKLQTLTLYCCPVTDLGMKYVGDMPCLRCLTLSHCEVGATGLFHLCYGPAPIYSLTVEKCGQVGQEWLNYFDFFELIRETPFV